MMTNRCKITAAVFCIMLTVNMNLDPSFTLESIMIEYCLLLALPYGLKLGQTLGVNAKPAFDNQL